MNWWPGLPLQQGSPGRATIILEVSD